MKNDTNSRGRKTFSPAGVIIAAMGLCAALMLSSCSKKTSDAIIGKWRVRDSGEIVQFRKDGTVTSFAKSGDSDTGIYTFTDNTHMKVEINRSTNAPVVVFCTVRMHGNTMDVDAVMTGSNRTNATHMVRMK